MTMNQMARLRRAYQSSGSNAGEHHRTIFAKYHHGAWYFTREAKSGATSVRCANLMALAKGVPHVSQSYKPMVRRMETKQPASNFPVILKRTDKSVCATLTAGFVAQTLLSVRLRTTAIT